MSVTTYSNNTTDPDVPSTDKVKFYFKDDNPHWRDDTGAVHNLSIPVFGQNFKEESNDTEMSATGSYVTAITLTTDELPVGRYRIGQSICWNMNTTSYNIIVEMLVDGVVAESLAMESKDANSDIRNYNTGYGYMDVNNGGSTHTISIRFKSESSSYTARMYHKSIEFWRVS